MTFLSVLAVLAVSPVLVWAGRAPGALELRDDLAVYQRPVTTTVPEAQRWFDQGLVLYYGFNHEAAIESFARVGGFYTLYRVHNFHFLAYGVMFDGQRDIAMTAAREMVAQIPLETVRTYPDFLDGFMAVPTHVMVRFGMWNELPAEPKPPQDLLATVAFWHCGRTVALAALGRVTETVMEYSALEEAYESVPESRLIGNNPARSVLEVGLPMAEGELEYRRGNVDRAFELLREAARVVDERFRSAWTRADIKIHGSCYCRTKSD